MTDNEMELIMRAYDTHRDDVKAALNEQRQYLKGKIDEFTSVLQQQQIVVVEHSRRFQRFDDIAAFVGKVATVTSVAATGIWAIITFTWGK